MAPGGKARPSNVGTQLPTQAGCQITMPSTKNQAIRQINDTIALAVRLLRKGVFLRARATFRDAKTLFLSCKVKYQIVLPDETEFYIDALISYSYIKGYDSIDKSTEHFKSDDLKVKGSIDIINCKYPRRHFPMFLRLMHFFKRECWRECLYYSAFIQKSEVCSAIENKYKTVPIFNKQLIPELDVSYCNELMKNMEETAIYGLVEQVAKLPEIHKVNSSLNGLNWIKLWSEDLHQWIVKRVREIKKPTNAIELHKLFHSEVLPKFYSINEGDENQGKSLYCYYKQEFMYECEQCIRAKFQEDSKDEISRSLRAQKYEDDNNEPEFLLTEYGTNDCMTQTVEMLERRMSEVKIEEKRDSRKRKIDENASVKGERKCQQTQTDKVKVNQKSIQTESIGAKKKHIAVQTDDSKYLKEEELILKWHSNDKIAGLLEGIKKQFPKQNTDLKNCFTQEIGSILTLLADVMEKKDLHTKLERDSTLKELKDNIVEIEKEKAIAQEEANKCQIQFIEKDIVKYKKELVSANAEMRKCVKQELSSFENILIEDKKKENRLELEVKMLREKLDNVDKEKSAMRSQFEEKLDNVEKEKSVIRRQLEESIQKFAEQKTYLEKIVIGQMCDKFDLYKNTYTGMENSCRFVMNNISDLQDILTLRTMPSIQDSQVYLSRWQKTLFDLQSKNDKLKVFFNHIKSEAIKNGNFESGNWPELADLPMEAFRFLFDNLKRNIKAFSSLSSPYPNNVASPRTLNLLPPPPPSRKPIIVEGSFAPPVVQILPKFVPNMIDNGEIFSLSIPLNFGGESDIKGDGDRQEAVGYCHKPDTTKSKSSKLWPSFKNKKSPEAKETNKTTSSATAGNESKREDIKKFKEDKALYEYLKENCPEVEDEDQLITSIFKAMRKFKGSFNNVPKDDILKEVKSAIMNVKLDVWPTDKTPIVHPKEDLDHPHCPICYDELTTTDKYILACKHEYHKECITQWLKTKSTCAMCRVPCVIEEANNKIESKE